MTASSSDDVSVLHAARDVGGDSQAAAKWVGEPGAAYYAGDSKADQMQLAATNLLSMQWRVIDVLMPHKVLATLYAKEKDGHHDNVHARAVPGDLLRHLLGGNNVATV